MDWQYTFYVLGSLFMLGWLFFLLMLMVTVLLLYRKTRAIQDKVSEKLDGAAVPLIPLVVPLLPFILPLVKRLLFRSRR